MKLIKAKLKDVKKGGMIRFMPMKEARTFFKGERDSMKKKTWCEGINNAVLVEPSKQVYVESLNELRVNVNPLELEWIYI